MTTALVYVGVCVLLAAAAEVIGEVVAKVYYELVWLPRIAGEED